MRNELFIQDRFNRPDALVIPQDIINRINSRGYLRIDETYGETSEQLPNLSYEKIDLIKILDLDLIYSFPGNTNLDKILENFYEKGMKRGTKQFYHGGLNFLKRSSFFSLLFGKLSIEEFKENYLIEIINPLESENESKEMKELFETYGYKSEIVGERNFIYLNKKISKKKTRYIRTETFYPCRTSDQVSFIKILQSIFEKLRKDFNRQWSRYLNVPFEIEGNEQGHIGVSLYKISNNSLHNDKDYQIKLYRKYIRYGKDDQIIYEEVKNMFSICGKVTYFDIRQKDSFIRSKEFSFCPDINKIKELLKLDKLYREKKSKNLYIKGEVLRGSFFGIPIFEPCSISFENLIYHRVITVKGEKKSVVRFKKPLEKCLIDFNTKEKSLMKYNITYLPDGTLRIIGSPYKTCSIEFLNLGENYYLIRNYKMINSKVSK